MGNFKDVLSVLFVAFLGLLSVCEGYKFYVGGRDGWVTKPSEDYNHWAERNRFQVNDTLLFKYKKGDDSVLVVTRDNYVHCYTKAPLQALVEGESEFEFNRSGPFYFISGNEDHCKQGQRLIVVVLAVRQRKAPPSPSLSPPELAPPPQVSSPPSLTPVSPALAPAPEDEGDLGPSGSDGTTSPAPAPKPNSGASRDGGGSFWLAIFVGAIVLLGLI